MTQPPPADRWGSLLDAAMNRRQQWLARHEAQDAAVLLAEAIDLARLALALDDKSAAAMAFSDAAVFAVAAAISARLETSEILVAIPRSGGQATPVVIAPECVLPASVWCDALASALVTENREIWPTLTAESVVGRLALGTTHPVVTRANAFCRSSGLLMIGIVASDPAIDALFKEARGQAASADEIAFLECARDLAHGRILGWLQRVEEAVAAWHRARVEITTPSGAFPLHWAALAALAARLGAVSERLGSVPEWLGSTLTEGLVSAVSVRCPLRSIRHPLEPHWWFDLEGVPQTGRENRIEIGNSGRLLAFYRAGTGLPDIEAAFELCGPDEPPSAPWALDAGELLLVSDLHARQVAAEPAAEAEERQRQQEHLSQAVATLDLLLAQAPSGATSVPERAFRSARGRAVRDAEPGRFDVDRLQAIRHVYLRSLDDIEASVPDSEERAREREAAARQDALAAIEIIKAELAPLVRALSADRTGDLLRAVRPRPEDYAKAFRGPLAAAAAEAFADVWAEPLSLQHPRPEQSQLLLDVAPAGMLVSDNELSNRFPGGYRKLAPHLVPNRVWARWKLVRPGETIGMAYDGLVWLDDHWAWFPKPYRVLADYLEWGLRCKNLRGEDLRRQAEDRRS